MKHCSIKNCGGKHEARGYCHKHYQRWSRHGNPNKVLTHFSPNKIVRRCKIVHIQLNRRDGTVLWAKVDAKDWDGLKLARYRWCALWSPGAATFYVGTVTFPEYLHRFLLNASLIDHKNHNGLDNRRKNLRPATHSQNSSNRRRRRIKHASRFRGIWRTPNNTWRWKVVANGKYCSGTCKTEIEAARASFDTRKKIHGKFKNFGRRP